jgi:hypothetical protein
MRKDLPKKRERELPASRSRAQGNSLQKNRPQRTHDDLERYGKAEKCSGIDSSIIGATVLYNEINKVQNALWKSTQEGRWTITTLI